MAELGYQKRQFICFPYMLSKLYVHIFILFLIVGGDDGESKRRTSIQAASESRIFCGQKAPCFQLLLLLHSLLIIYLHFN